MHSVLLPGDQYHLYATSAKALTTARRRGDTKFVEFWSGNPILSITISPYVIASGLPFHAHYLFRSLPFVRLPIEKRVSALATSLTPDIAPILTGAKDPFLYNPRKALTAQVIDVVHLVTPKLNRSLGSNIGGTKRKSRIRRDAAESLHFSSGIPKLGSQVITYSSKFATSPHPFAQHIWGTLRV